MRYSAEHKELTRRKILDAAARRFRVEGYDGLGIDGLANAAGVTNGAFYGHFGSKAEAFREVTVEGLAELRAGIEQYRAKHGPRWLAEFARFYFASQKIDCAEDACALPSFAPEIARAPESTRRAFAAELALVVEAIADGMSGDEPGVRGDQAWIVLSLLSGGVTLLRSLPDRKLKRHVASALERAVAALALPAAAAKSR